MISVSALNIYPVKGCAAIPKTQLELDLIGPIDDRRWMVVELDGALVTQREVAKLCRLRATPSADNIRLDGPGIESINLWRPDGSEPRRTVRVWNDHCEAIDMGPDAADWCSVFLNYAVRLVYFPETTVRPTDPDYDRRGGRVGFADGYPLLLTTESSLEDLNGRMQLPLPMNRFRPNVVVTGSEPFEEDRWRRFRIGDLRIDAVKPCARCMVTTTDQATGERAQEPLRTLATYRNQGGGVMFGMNLVHRDTGRIRLGDLLVETD